ncbi:hypothetical protein N7510_010211 [Penicillium lagena]|uniref:uncharacterized protein n=1 Tax=Penicillium lagena TaxID=94218 RepID=UPI0025400D07|nr:uncharacterized protein N7510_010211 [Penicillium lagena]KAJ5605057.1 hypothetical protein N7510_010211 [Penicillium lagena]
MMLHLPTELIQLVLRSCDTTTFFQVAYACHTLLEIASSSREAILYHLRQTPGETDDTQSFTTKGLFGLLMHRAYRQLYGAEFYAEFKVFTVQGLQIEPRACSWNLPNRDQLILAFKQHPHAYYYYVRQSHLRYRRRFESPRERDGVIQVLRTSVDDSAVHVLHRFKPFVNQEDRESNHPFVKQALHSNGVLFMAIHDLDSPLVHICAFPDYDDYEPKALYGYHGGFAISWQHAHKEDVHEVVHYDTSASSKLPMPTPLPDNAPVIKIIVLIIDVSYDPCVVIGSDTNGERAAGMENPGPAVRLTINDGSQLLYHYRAQTLYGGFQKIGDLPSFDQPKPKLYKNSCSVAYSSAFSLQFAIDIPFYATHEQGDANQGTLCHWQYLAFGIATHRIENWTAACILKSEAYCRAQNCSHELNHDRGRRFDEWTVVARLLGFRQADVSHGSQVAASSCGTRIAVATWKTLYIWALEPDALLDDEDRIYPRSWKDLDSGAIEISPVILDLDAVCYQLRFGDRQNELIVIADRGLIVVDVGRKGRGVRSTHTLPYPSRELTGEV